MKKKRGIQRKLSDLPELLEASQLPHLGLVVDPVLALEAGALDEANVLNLEPLLELLHLKR